MGGTRPFKVLTDQERAALEGTGNGSPPPRHRTFAGKSPTPGEEAPWFTLIDQRFDCVHELPAKAAALMGIYWTPRSAMEFLESVLQDTRLDEDGEEVHDNIARLHTTLDRKDVIINMSELFDICNWLAEVYTTQTPTNEPAGSPAGSPQTGTSSTDDSPSEVEATSMT